MDIISIILNSEFAKKYVLLPQSNNEKIYAFSVTDKKEIKKILSTKDIHFFICGSSREETYEFKISDEKYVFSFVDNYNSYVVASSIMNEVSSNKSKIEMFRNILSILNKNSVDNKSNSSLILQRLSIKNPDVLNEPEEFLGPNYKDVLKFWMKLDELSKEQLRVVNERHVAFFDENRSEWRKARDLAWEASKKVVGAVYASNAGGAAWDVINSSAAYRATRELIGGVEDKVFLKMFDNL